MMQIVHCKFCNGETIPMGGISVNVALSKHVHCDKCYHTHEEKRTFFFCSQKCFHYFIQAANGRQPFRWIEYDRLTGQSIKPV